MAEEINKVKFENQLDTEEVAESALNEVMTKKNFYFAVDENKKSKNIRVHNRNAPGNHHNKPNVIIPHEHVSINHHLDTSTLN